MHYLTLEWQKFKKNSVFLFMVFLYFLLLPLQILAINSMDITVPGLASGALVEFPSIWSFLAYGGSWVAYFCWGVLGIYLFSNEFSQGTFRQNIISGLTRKELYFGKVLFLFTVILIATAYYVVVALVLGSIYTPDDKVVTMFERSELIFRYLVMSFGYVSLGVFIAVLVRKTAISVFLYFAYSLFLEPMVRWFFHKQILDNRSMHFYPANSFEDLTPIPLHDVSLTRDLVNGGDLALYLTPNEALISSLAYLILFFCLGYWMIRYRDL